MLMIGDDNPSDISLYFHIPFCTKKCHYCHFYVLPNKNSFHQLLMEGLLLDLEKWEPELEGKNLISIYFGGGTPSLLQPDHIHLLIEKARSLIPFTSGEIEITLEVNPETVSRERMDAFADAGINRISLGIQTLDDHLLAKLSREHKVSTILDSLEITKTVGFNNISVDLMYDIPGQTLTSWRQTLSLINQLPITHLSLYNLTIEPNTVFFKHKKVLEKELPDGQTSAKMYQEAIESLDNAGLKRYEISAFSRQNLYSRHNVGYWIGRPFLGFGPSAFSYWNNSRFRAAADIYRYVNALREKKSPYDFSEKLSPDKQKRELIAIGLRMLQGVHMETFEKKHGKMDPSFFATILKLEQDGLIQKKEERLSLTEKGTLFYDTVAEELI